MQSVMSHDFSKVPQADIQRSSFNRTSGHKTTFDAGYLIPVFVDEVLPGDTFTMNMTAFARMATPIYPIMDNLYMDTFFFFVPNRLTWSHWEQFNGQLDAKWDPTDYTPSDYIIPYTTASSVPNVLTGAGFGVTVLGDSFLINGVYGVVLGAADPVATVVANINGLSIPNITAAVSAGQVQITDAVGAPIILSPGIGAGLAQVGLVAGTYYGSTGYAAKSVFDYFGLPTAIPGFRHSVLPLRAYGLIWNEFFRDENLQDFWPVSVGDGPDNPADFSILPRNKRHDYFTSCLPFPQKGPTVMMPLGTSAPVVGIGKLNQTYVSGTQTVYESDGTTSIYADSQVIDNTAPGQEFYVENNPANLGYPNIHVDLAQATAATINELREAFQVQAMYERDAMGGTRYTEILHAHFGVTSPDSRLQRPELLSVHTDRININPVAQTTSSAAPTSTDALGALAAIGTITTNRAGFVKSFVEHGYIIGFVSVRADLTYQQGLDRFWSRETRFDFYWPLLANLGEQAVLNKELVTMGVLGGSDDDGVFGYQERYAEYRYKPSKITGEFRSNYATPLDAWHLSQFFDSGGPIQPDLGSDFIREMPPMSRVLAVTTQSQFIFDSYFDLKCARPMPMYAKPGMLTRF